VRVSNGASGPAADGHLRPGTGQRPLRRPARSRPGAPGLARRQHPPRLADRHWDRPCEGIWETRGGQKDFTYGRVMSWTAFDRGIRLASRYGGRPTWHGVDEPGRLFDRCGPRWSVERESFVQHYDTDVLDYSLLRAATVGFITPDGQQWQSTHRVRCTGAGHRQPRVPLRPCRVTEPTGGRGGHVLLVRLQPRRRPRSWRSPRRGDADVRQDADVREPRRPLRGGDRAHRRAAGQLPPGVHTPGTHRLDDHHGRRPGQARDGSAG